MFSPDQVESDSILIVVANSFDETVVVAYNTTTQHVNAGSVTVVKRELVYNLPTCSVDKALQDPVPGLLVTDGTGQSDSGLGNFVLRGMMDARAFGY